MKLTQTRAIWRIPASWERDAARRARHASFDSTDPVVDARLVRRKTADDHAPAILKAAFVFALLALTVFDRFGLSISSSYSISPGLFGIAALLGAAALSRSLRLAGYGSLLYIAVIAIAGASFAVNTSLSGHQYASFGSLLLLLVLYAPFAFTLRPSVASTTLWQWFVNLYLTFALVLAIAGILQFYAQFVVRTPWLFDYTPLIPSVIRGSGTYNTTNVAGALIKSNGFFLREASGFSFMMAFALLCEWSTRKRKWVMAPFVLGLIVSYSGSGLLAIAVAMLFPLGQRTAVRVLAIVAIGAVIVLVFGDALNLSYTLDRVGEINSSRSSAYCRFVAPGVLVAEQIDSDVWTALLGHGPGTTQRMSSICETTYGKVLFEYGMLGAVVFSALVVGAIHRTWVPVRMRAALIVHWFLLGGNLLAPEALMFILCICGWWPEKQPDAERIGDRTWRKPT